MLGGISKAMVYRYVKQGELHPIKLGSRTLFPREELERFVKAQAAK
jgi:excisionase family DNA binding protein